MLLEDNITSVFLFGLKWILIDSAQSHGFPGIQQPVLVLILLPSFFFPRFNAALAPRMPRID